MLFGPGLTVGSTVMSLAVIIIGTVKALQELQSGGQLLVKLILTTLSLRFFQGQAIFRIQLLAFHLAVYAGVVVLPVDGLIAADLVRCPIDASDRLFLER